MRSDSKNRIAVRTAPRAPAVDALENAPGLASPCSVSKERSCFKDNSNVNKSGASSLCLEPQQMKKRKKGGKCNLRKSLAWDRAFSTEEGVLDPLELSAISGVSCRAGLPFISEDTPVSSSQDEDFRKYKENYQSSPMLDLSSSNRTTLNSLALQKVSTNSGIKLRPANTNVGKATRKESKLPKVPGLKPSLSPACATIKSTIPRESHVNHNRITQPDFSIQRDAKPKSCPKICNDTQNASIADIHQSANHSDGNLDFSSFNRHLSINTSLVTIDKPYNSAPKTTPSNFTQIRPENSCESQRYDSATFSQNAHNNAKILYPLQNQTTRPSGLRMPSPSLSFFSQPKPSVFRNLPSRDTESYFNWSRNPGSLRLQGNLSRTTKSRDAVSDSIISRNKGICSRSESTAAAHVSDSDLVKPNMERTLMYEGPLKKTMTVKGSHGEAESRKIGIEVPSQNGSCEQAILNNAIDDCRVKGESCGIEWRNAELGSKQNSAILESQSSSAIDEQYDKKNILAILRNAQMDCDSIQCTDGFYDRMQNIPAMHSDCRKSSKQDSHEAHLKKTNSLINSLGENERTDSNSSSEKERVGEQMDVSQQGNCRESVKALEWGETVKESSANPAAELHMPNSVFVSTVEDCKNHANFKHEIGNDSSQSCESPEVQHFHLTEMDSKQIGKLDIRDRLLAEKQQCLQNSKQEENVDELLPVVSGRKDGSKMVDTEIPLSLSLDNRQKNDIGKETAIAQPLRSLSPECENLSDCLHQDPRSIESNDNPLPQNMTQLSPEDTGKETEKVPSLQVSYANNELTTTMPLKSSESEISNLSGTKDTWALLAQSSESDMLDKCCFQQSECLVAGDELVVENLVYTDDCVKAENLPYVCSAVNAVDIVEDPITGQNIILKSISRNSTHAKESPLKHEACDDENETGGGTADAKESPFSDTNKLEVSEDARNPPSCRHPKFDRDTVEATLPTDNKHGDGLEEKKSLLLVIPPNAIPFSDEWLAAMEAAGEDILTRKSGAVQNSPPDKSLPEPSPWSPVKRKNNQIGPFDCTKKITAASDS
ncbi:hypothetical protein AAHA92_08611 [Salvia divinorum]|uniref:Uncharacterized protein n=1 Tax=Salvia divinorum TaxID=28513 RepID=A0ABD1HNS5_SALDI